MKSNLHHFPRAVSGLLGVRAEADPKTVLAKLIPAFETFKASYNDRVAALEGEVDSLAVKAAADILNGGGSLRPDDPEYTKTFAAYFRNGETEQELRGLNATGHRAQIHAAMSVGTNSDGGYLAPVEWDRQIRKSRLLTSPMRRLATVQTTGVGAFSTVWSNEAWGSGWVGETAARPATSTPTLSSLIFNTGEIYANVAVTQRLLDDVDFNLETWLANEVNGEFARQEDVAFISGNGTNKPMGLMTYVTGGAGAGVHPGGDLSVTTVVSPTAITFDELIDFAYSLTAPYRQNASWLMNSQTAAKLAKLKDGDGNYLWRESVIQGQPSTLLGYPVEFDENMAAATAGLTPIAFGDFKAGYLINDRIGTRILRDPYSNKPYVHFYCVKRVGAGLLDPNAIRLLKMAAS